MRARGTPPAPLRPSRKADLRALAIASGAMLGAAGGLWLPWQTWQIGGLTPLGDFALLAVLGLLAWSFVAARPTPRRMIWLLGTAVAVLLARELAWRFHPPSLAVLRATAVGILLALLLGALGYERYREVRAARSAAPALTAEALAGLGLGLLVLGWFAVGLARAL